MTLFENGFDDYLKKILLLFFMFHPNFIATAKAAEPMWDVLQNETMFGPFPKNEIDKMISSGIINRDTQVQAVGTKKWMNAYDVFDFPETEEDIQKKERQKRLSSLKAGWYISNDGKTLGPFKRTDLNQMFKDGVIVRKTELRHESWRNSIHAEYFFDFSNIPGPEDGWYIHDTGKPFGPFKKEAIFQMIKDGAINHQTLIRHESSNDWNSAEYVFKLSGLPMEEWIVWENDTVAGPYTEKALQSKIGSEVFSNGALCKKIRSNEWIPVTALIKPKQVGTEKKMRAAYSTDSLYPSADSAGIEARLTNQSKKVKRGNVIAALGMLGGMVGLGAQIGGILNEDKKAYYTGLGISAASGLLRLSGVLASGIAATRYTTMVSDKKFGWGLFTTGFVFGTAGSLIGTISANSSVPNNSLIIASAIGGQAMMNILWMAHCFRAKKLVRSHRHQASNAIRLTVVPYFSAHKQQAGLSLAGTF